MIFHANFLPIHILPTRVELNNCQKNNTSIKYNIFIKQNQLFLTTRSTLEQVGNARQFHSVEDSVP